MTQGRKNALGGGIAIAGFPIAVLGIIFMASGNYGIGTPFLGVGLCLIVAGVWSGGNRAA